MTNPVSGRALSAALNPIKRRLSMMASRAVVRLITDTESRQRLQVEILKGELRDGVERVQNYGYTSHPLPGCDAVLVCAGGSREQSIVVVVDDRRYRLKLQPGEVAMYDDLGNSVQLLRDRVKVTGVQLVEVNAPDVKIAATTITMDADTVTINAATKFNGTVEANGKRIDDTHKHINSGGTGLGGVPQ